MICADRSTTSRSAVDDGPDGQQHGADALDQTYDALRETFDAIKDGELQADNADVVWQLNSTVDQMVAAGQTLYITLVGLEQQPPTASGAWPPWTGAWRSCACASSWARCPGRTWTRWRRSAPRWSAS